MKFALDRYARLDSPIHRWEQPSKFVALMTLIFAFSGVRALWLLPPMLAVTAVLLGLSRLPLRFWLSRLRYPGVFIGTVVLLLPFAVGETVLVEVGGIALRQEGCAAALLLAVRFVCILTVGLVLFGTAPFLQSLKALRALGLPGTIVDMALLAYRYLESIGDILAAMQRALRLRGWRGDRFSRRNLKLLAALAGGLLVRSYEQSQRVYQAMILRGYGSRPPARMMTPQRLLWGDRPLTRLAFWLTLGAAAAFIAGELFVLSTPN